MTKVLTADNLRDGDKIKGDNGVTYTVRRSRQIKRKIPARYEKQTHLILETKGKVNGRSSKKQETVTAYSDDEFEVVSRPGMQWKVDLFKDKYEGYINALACVATGAIVTLAVAFSDVGTPAITYTMLATTAILGAGLTHRAYNNG